MKLDIYPIEVAVEIRLQEAQRAAAQERLARSVAGAGVCKAKAAGILSYLHRAINGLMDLAPSQVSAPRFAR